MSYSYLRKRIFKEKLVILYFHPWEAINMKEIILKQSNTFNIFKNLVFRPDRVCNTGRKFIIRFENFIKESISKNAEFIMLKELLSEQDKII